MEESLFEQMGGTYTQVGDYLIPYLALPEQEQKPIGVWGQRYLRYIKQHRPLRYNDLLMTGKLNDYLAHINTEAEEMFSRLVKQFAEKEGITEQMKVENQMLWVGRMNNIRSSVTELINEEIIYQECKIPTGRYSSRDFLILIQSIFQRIALTSQ